MTTRTRRRLTDEERAQRRAQDRERLEQAARRLVRSEGWQQWVRVRARNGLGRYSLGNQLLIAMQAPDARFVAGFHAWKDLGRRVRKGEHGIRILAPIPLRREDDPSAQAAEDRDQGRVVTLFKSVAVFDIAQTEPIPGREPVAVEPPSQPILGDSHADLLPRLVALAGDLGYTVQMRRLDGAADGWCDHKTRTIVANAALPANARVRVLVHELAHALGIGYAERGRARAEVMVDCVIFSPCQGQRPSSSGDSVGDRRHPGRSSSSWLPRM